MRWWAWRQTPPVLRRGAGREARFLMYHPPDFAGALPHSIGLEKGRLGLVHLFASKGQQAQNEGRHRARGAAYLRRDRQVRPVDAGAGVSSRALRNHARSRGIRRRRPS